MKLHIIFVSLKIDPTDDDILPNRKRRKNEKGKIKIYDEWSPSFCGLHEHLHSKRKLCKKFPCIALSNFGETTVKLDEKHVLEVKI